MMDKKFELIKEFFRHLRCSNCNNFFTNNCIQPVRSEKNSIIVRINCSHCGKNLGLAILGVDTGEYKNSLNFDEPPPITHEDVARAQKFFSGLGSDWMKYLPKID